MKMKLMLVDDHPLFLEGLEYLLETYGIQVAGVANNGEEAIEKARRLKPDIILMDIKMPKYSGIDGLKLIKAEMPDIKIIMLTTSDEDEDIFEAIKSGASGYLLKNTNGKELVDLLTAFENGDAPMSPGIAERNEKRALLTDRQLEVLEMVAKGNTYKKVGDALGLSERTVKYHMERIIELLHLENRAQVITYAVKIGLTENL